ncbi:MAG TPA: endolytic transglycosylase MltG [Christensenellaceae bacterium]|nr:endolytic transglycosylase MltG [Christensenellaceae bacterium]
MYDDNITPGFGAGLWKIIRSVLMFFCALLLLYGILSFAVSSIKEKWVNPVDVSDNSEVSFVVNSGDSLSRVSNNLEKQKLIRSSSFFKYFADFKGFGQKIQAGEYKLKRSMTLDEILDSLSSGDGKPIVRDITVIPSWTIEDIANYLVKEGVIASSDTFLSLCKAGEKFNAYYYVHDVLSSPDKHLRKYALEGYLAPDTYEIYTNVSEEDIIKKLVSQTEAVYPADYHERAEELKMSMDDIFTLASLIEKEAKTADFARVSAVFHNRLKQNISLGSDVTIKYVLGTKRMVLSNEDINIDSPYNSYKHKGLPPGPICNPSANAIRAALYPDEQFLKDNMLYFCSKNPDTGELHFSKTLKEHEQAVKIYLPLWQAFDDKNNP